MESKIVMVVLFILLLLFPFISLFLPKKAKSAKDRIKLKAGESGIIEKGDYRVEIEVVGINAKSVSLNLRFHKKYLRNSLFFEAKNLVINPYRDGFLAIFNALEKKPDWNMILTGRLNQGKKTVDFWLNRPI